MIKFFRLPLMVSLLFVAMSCSNDVETKDLATKEVVSQSSIPGTNYDASIHSKGLEYFYNNFDFDGYEKNPQNKLIRTPIEGFLLNNKLPVKDLSLLDEKLFDNADYEIISLTDYGFQFTEDFYKAAMSIVDLKVNDVKEAEKELTSILTSKSVSNLSNLEKTILSIGAETYVDSYVYWDKNIASWDKKMNYPPVPPIITTARRQDVVRQDVLGGLQGAAWGALWGFMLGGPAGAAYGAAHGGAQSAIAASSTALVINLTGYYQVPVQVYPNLYVPVGFTMITVDKGFDTKKLEVFKTTKLQDIM